MTRAQAFLIAEAGARRVAAKQARLFGASNGFTAVLVPRLRMLALSREEIHERSRALSGHPADLRERLRARWSR